MGSCSEAHPWIDVALDKFFARAESRSIEGLGLWRHRAFGPQQSFLGRTPLEAGVSEMEMVRGT